MIVLTWVGEREHSIHIRVSREIFQNMPSIFCCGYQNGKVWSPHYLSTPGESDTFPALERVLASLKQPDPRSYTLSCQEVLIFTSHLCLFCLALTEDRG